MALRVHEETIASGSPAAGPARRSGVRDPRLLWIAGTAAAAFVAATMVARSGEPAGWELSAFNAVNRLPDWLYYVVWPFMQYGVFATIPIAAIVAIALKQRRLAVMLACSGTAIYLLAKLVKDVAQRGRPMSFENGVIEREQFAASSLGYTSGHVAVAATIATLTFFHLPRRLQQMTVALVGIVAFGRMYVGAHLPLDMIGAIAMGVTAGTFVTYAFGSGTIPSRRRSSSSHRVGRHPGDIARVVVGITVLGVASLAVQRTRVTVFEADVFRLFNNLPSSLSGVLVSVMQLGNLFAGPVLAVVAIMAIRRWRPTADLLVAGPLAWVVAKLVKNLAQRPRPGGLLEDVQRYGTSEGLGFISGHTAVAAALVTVLSPYLPRTWRRVAWMLPWLVGIARIFEGAHLPLDIVGGVAAGWVVGAALDLTFGAPHRMPGVREARAVLERAGWKVNSIVPVRADARGSFPFVATVADEEAVFVKLLDPEPRDRDWIFRIGRFLAVRDVRDEAEAPDAATRADHEAAMGLLAHNRGVRVPITRRIEQAGTRRWLVQDYVASRAFDTLDSSAVDDDLLVDLWYQVKVLHGAQLAHRDLVGSNVLVDGRNQVWLTDFAHAQSGAAARSLDNDIAELLVSISLVVGPERAVLAAAAELGREALAPVLPELQPLTLTAENRAALRDNPALLGPLRAAIADKAGLAPTLVKPSGHRWRAVAAVIVGVATIGSLVAVASPASVIARLGSPGYRWLGLALLAATLLVLFAGAAQAAATDRRLALARTALARLAASAPAPIEGRAAANAALAAHLARMGITAHGMRLLGVSRLAAHAVVLFAAAAVAIHDFPGTSLPDSAALLALLAAGCVAVQLAVAQVAPPRPRATSPAQTKVPRLSTVLGASVLGEAALGALCLAAATSAFGPAPPIAVVVVVFVISSGLAAALPAGGAGSIEVTMTLLLTATGMDLAGAVLAAIACRALLFWLPLAIGRALGPRLRGRLVI